MVDKDARYYYDYILTTFFGCGYFPKAPGTFASVVAAVPIIFLPDSVRPLVLIISSIILFIVSIPSVRRIEAIAGDDSPIIVIDEVIGVLVLFSSPLITINIWTLLIGVIIFRFFDIFKPWIIGRINAERGALYVILDDVVAGVFAAVVLHFVVATLELVFMVSFIKNIFI